MISFGGGIILSALALVLIPHGLQELELLPLTVSFLAGSLLFMWLDRYLSNKGGKTSTLLAMLMDFIPEAIALGAVFSADIPSATLLAVFIGLQNLPEAFVAYRDLQNSKFMPGKILLIFFFLSFFGIAAALMGNLLLGSKPEITSFLMVFASGGILYLLFQDIVPESKLKASFVTSLGASLGFLIGIIGKYVL
jgi:ZIP family zinc transporter